MFVYMSTMHNLIINLFSMYMYNYAFQNITLLCVNDIVFGWGERDGMGWNGMEWNEQIEGKKMKKC